MLDCVETRAVVVYLHEENHALACLLLLSAC